ncbi:MAG: DoxX family protein [Prevotellaceae bacterium]|jgi:uncharacterized membrane protein YphA (DoxX/SURF4 family)|nr:DoxX family protein [Prevotellaceae bacterium]
MSNFLKNTAFRTTVVVIFRILIGCVFIFSGFVKVIDPFGGFYKVEDYLLAFGWDFFIPLAFVGSVLLSTAEFLLGICLLFGANIRTTSLLTMLFMGVMLPLTLYIAVFNPVTDCGCFGDALIISNWATFWKNVVFSFMVVVIFLWRDYSPQLFTQRTDWLIAIYAGFFALALAFYSYQNLPVIDFRPYKIGTDIQKSMEIPENEPRDEYETVLIYEKNGVAQEFTLENYPQDSSWTFVDSKSKLIKKGYEPPIHDFTIENPEMGDITEDIIENDGYTFLLVMPKVEKASTSKRNEINAVYDFTRKHGYNFYALTATGLGSKELEEFVVESGGAEYPFMNTDEITLKTIIRSNPGLVLVKDGIIINKWSYPNIPAFDRPLEESEWGQLQLRNNTRTIVCAAIAFIVPLLVLLGLDHSIGLIQRKRRKNK